MSDKYGLLLTPDAKLHRQYFREMVKLLGVKVIYRAPKKDKSWTSFGEIDSNYMPSEIVGCIVNDNVDQRTMKRMGWVTEIDNPSIFISVDYDLHDLQVGAIFILPSAIDSSEGRMFRVAAMQVGAIYPSSVTCQLVPEYYNSYDEQLNDHRTNSFNLISNEETLNGFL